MTLFSTKPQISSNMFYLCSFVRDILLKTIFCFSIILLSTLFSRAQEPAPTPTPPEEPIKVFTEEVNLNVTAQTDSGKFVPTLKTDDLLVVEEGTPQTVTGMKRVPANVLVLLDTGSELNFVKSIALTRLTAKLFVYSLLPGDTVGIMQYYNKIETVSDWTTDFNAAADKLDTKLFSGKRSRFSDALSAAVETFKSRPSENRHLVLISDGLDNVADESTRQQSIQKLLAANITVHVLSYTQLEASSAQKASKRIKIGDGRTKPRIDPVTLETIIGGIPIEVREQLRLMNQSQALLIFDLDNERLKFIRRKSIEWDESQTRLQNLAEDTGGMFQAPEEIETLLKLAIQVANAVDSNYVITYTPTKPLSQGLESRKVRVSSRCVGITIRSRHRIVLNQPDLEKSSTPAN